MASVKANRHVSTEMTDDRSGASGCPRCFRIFVVLPYHKNTKSARETATSARGCDEGNESGEQVRESDWWPARSMLALSDNTVASGKLER